MEKFAVLVAGGKGVRMGTAVPKQFLTLKGHPVLYHTIKAFKSTYPDIQLILVLPADQLSYAQMVLQSFPERIDVTIVAGGETRYHSVQNGLKAVSKDSIVFVHDGVRPIVSKELIQRCYEQALEMGSAIPAIPVAESMRVVDGDMSKTIDRDALRIIQTPQTFQSSILLPAFEQEYQPSFTDEATVVEAHGIKIYLVEGEQGNIKVTRPDDLIIAEALLNAKEINE
jgi:2-C-methyl-D-erythritol 4-phosphate cytidylyltransferase